MTDVSEHTRGCEGCRQEAEAVRANIVSAGVMDEALIERTVGKAVCSRHRRPVGIVGHAPCLHDGPEPMRWHSHDPEEGVDWCECGTCGELVPMEPPDPEVTP